MLNEKQVPQTVPQPDLFHTLELELADKQEQKKRRQRDYFARISALHKKKYGMDYHKVRKYIREHGKPPPERNAQTNSPAFNIGDLPLELQEGITRWQQEQTQKAEQEKREREIQEAAAQKAVEPHIPNIDSKKVVKQKNIISSLNRSIGHLRGRVASLEIELEAANTKIKCLSATKGTQDIKA